MWRKIQALQYLISLTQQQQYVLTTAKEMNCSGENAGKQCVAMSLSAIIYHHIEDVNLWTSSTLNNILGIGNNLYTSIRYSVRINDYLLLTDVPGIVSLFDKLYTLQYSESLTGSVFMTSNDGPFMSLQNSLQEVFSQQNYNCCLLLIQLQFLKLHSRVLKFLTLIQGIYMGCPIHLGLVLCSALKDLKTSYHICSCHAYKQGCSF